MTPPPQYDKDGSSGVYLWTIVCQQSMYIWCICHRNERAEYDTNHLIIQNSRHYIHVNATHLKCILFSTLSHFSFKTVCIEEEIRFVFRNICIIGPYHTNTARLNKKLIMTNYVIILTNIYHTKHVCWWLSGEKLNFKC